MGQSWTPFPRLIALVVNIMLIPYSEGIESGSEGVTLVTPEDRENIIAMKRRGLSDANVASVLRINPKTVSVVVVQEKVIPPKVQTKRYPELKPEVPWVHPGSVGDENWETRGLCRIGGYDPDLWFPDPTDFVVRDLAQRVCYRCPVIMECRTTALARGEKHGLWGGLTETQRKKMRQKERDLIVAEEDSEMMA